MRDILNFVGMPLFSKIKNMKWLNILFLFGIYSIGYAQETSLRLQFTPDTTFFYDSGVQIAELTDGYMIIGPTACINADNYYVNNCLGLMRTDETGNVVWTKVYDGGADTLFHDFLLRTFVVRNDTVYTASYVRINDSWGIRLVVFNEMGEILNTKDLAIPNNHLFIRGMIFSDNTLILIGSLVVLGERSVFIRQFDLGFNLLAEKELGHTNKPIYNMDLKKAMDGGYLLVYEESVISPQEKTLIYKLDDQFNILHSKEMPISENPGGAVNIIEVEENSYMVAWNKDLSYTLYDTFPYPATIYKLDSLFNVEWEYVFVHKAVKEHISFVKTSEGNLFGAGATDYFVVHDIYPNRGLGDGWCFLMDTDGTLLWERTIADNTKDPISGIFRYGIETINGFAIAGEIGITNDARTQDVWLLTLDENGCWNGNCNEYIIITGDTTSITGTDDVLLTKGSIKSYPNPTGGVLTIEYKDTDVKKNRSVKVSDMDGKIVAGFNLIAPKSTINLSHLGKGIYFVTHVIDGKPIDTQKIIVHH